MVDGEPTVVERLGDEGWWWDTNKTAKFGDIAAYHDDDYIYILGHPPNSETGWLAEQYVYQARVKPASAFDLDQYEYWWGRKEGWKGKLLSRFDTETAVMWGVGQGQIVYSKHFGAYLYVHVGKPLTTPPASIWRSPHAAPGKGTPPEGLTLTKPSWK